MSSRFRIELVLAGGLALAGCHKAPPANPPGGTGLAAAPVSGLIPAGGCPPPVDARALPYYDNAAAVTNGMRFYKQMNCGGCHFNGGGGIGPALMDDTWIYGGRMDQIFNSIYQGRPNGMPAWGGKIPEDAMWQIAAYVRSMSLPATIAANPVGGVPSQRPAPVPRDADLDTTWRAPLAPGQPTSKGPPPVPIK